MRAQAISVNTHNEYVAVYNESTGWYDNALLYIQSNSKCEGCQKDCSTVKNFTQFQCVGQKPHKLCDKCRNLSTCPIHPWAKKR